MIKLPKPVAWELLFNNGKHDDFTTDKGEAHEYGENKVPLYTESQMRQEIRDALEEALVICRTVYFDEYPEAETWERSTEHQCIEKLKESV